MKLKDKIIKLREEGKTYNQIQQILDCSKGIISFYCSKNHIKPCLNCGKETKNLKFCSKQCRIDKSHEKYIKKCNNCDKFIHNKFKYCKKCQQIQNSLFNDMKLKDIVYGIEQDASNRYAKVRDRARTIYKNSNKSKCCAVCGYSLHYDICHIKAISKFGQDSKVSEVNNLNNLIALCRNHHWELDNGYISIEKITN